MARRYAKHSDNTEGFGSDSFLDIVANIVGILIILIVIVGLRVRNAPVVDPNAAAKAERAQQFEANLQERERLQREHEQATAQRLEQIEQIELENQRRLEDYRRALANLEQQKQQQRAELARREQARDDWKRRLEQRRQEIDAQQRKQEVVDRTVAETSNEIQKLESALAKAQERLQARLEAQKADTAKLELAQAELRRQKNQFQLTLAKWDRQSAQWESLRQKLLQTKQQFAEPNEPPKQTAKWVHYPSARGEYSEKPRIYLRCKNGRIAYTFAAELAAEAMRKSEHQLNLQQRFASGRVGPIGGFSLSYRIVSRVIGDPVGPQLQTRQLESFSLHGDSDDLGETPERITQPASRLQAILLQRPPTKYIVACWVYPDSFKAAKAMSTFLNQQGYAVSLLPVTKDATMDVGPAGLRAITQ